MRAKLTTKQLAYRVAAIHKSLESKRQERKVLQCLAFYVGIQRTQATRKPNDDTNHPIDTNNPSDVRNT